MADINPETENLRKALGRIVEDFDKSSRHTGDYAAAQDEAAAKVKQSSDDTKAALKQFGDQLGQSALAYGKALTTGGEGTAKYCAATEGAANAVGGLVGKFRIFGAIRGGVIKVCGG